VKVFPVGPFAHEVGVGDDDARRRVVGRKHSDWLAGLHKEGFLVAEMFELADDGVEALPVAGGAADAAIDDEVRRALCHFGIEVVHQAAQSGFLLPAFAAQGDAARGADGGNGGGAHGSPLT
jgi:hypothetical protein